MSAQALVYARPTPDCSVIFPALEDANFADCYETPDPQPQDSALQTWLDLMRQTPPWISYLMALRNRIVVLAGLKDVGQLSDLASCDASQYHAYMAVVTPFHRRIARTMLARAALLAPSSQQTHGHG